MDVSKSSKSTKGNDFGIVKRPSCAYISHHTKYIQKINTGENNNQNEIKESDNKLDKFSVANSDNEVIHVNNEEIGEYLGDNLFRGKKIGTIINPKHILRFDINNVPIKKGIPHYHHVSFIDKIKSEKRQPLVEVIDIECHKKYHMTNNYTQSSSKGKGNCCFFGNC